MAEEHSRSRRALAGAVLAAGAALALGFAAPGDGARGGGEAAGQDGAPDTGATREVGGAREASGAVAAGAAQQPIVVRAGGGAEPRPGRARRRRSLAYFAQMSDPQIADEMSPARFDFLGPRRPQDALGTQTLDQAVRSVSRRTLSRVPASGGARAQLGFALMTGDLTDNHQLNEVRWAVRVLNGGRVDPFSGRRVSRANRCRGAGPRERRRLNRLVAGRGYTGPQDYRDWPGRAAALYRSFWDPSRRPPGGGPYAAFPRYPGLMDRAQRPFTAQGLAIPWYAVRGNHDGLALGRYSALHHPPGVATGCRKLFPGAGGLGIARQHPDPWGLARRLVGRVALVPPDPRRRFVSVREFKRLHGRADSGHGFGFASRRELRRSRGAAAYYAFSPRRELRFVGLDTVSDSGGASGQIDHPQYRWLARELRDAQRRRQLVVVFGHHTLDTMSNPAADERLRRDADPRRSTPVHHGSALRDLFLRRPNVVMYVAGHIHSNRVRGIFPRGHRGGFWEVVTAGHSDGPQHSRLLELMRNGDGTVSIFSTLLNHAAPLRAPRSGTPAAGLGNARLASISRLLAANVPWRRPVSRLRPRLLGGRAGRAVELVLPDPLRR